MLITGGAGFIGSNYVRHVLENPVVDLKCRSFSLWGDLLCAEDLLPCLPWHFGTLGERSWNNCHAHGDGDFAPALQALPVTASEDLSAPLGITGEQELNALPHLDVPAIDLRDRLNDCLVDLNFL